jgi:hypothetical protein
MRHFNRIFTIAILFATFLFAGAPDPPANISQSEWQQMKEELKAQRELIVELRKLIQAQQPSPAAAPAPVQAGPELATHALPAASPDSGAQSNPLAVRLGNVAFTPIGFLDFMSVFRSANVGSGLGTSFGATPMSDTVAGHRSEWSMGAQNSRVGARLDGDYHGFKFRGLLEADFMGYVPANLYTTTNSYGFRLREAYFEGQWKKWDFLAGQAWSLVTPNRLGVSADDRKLYLTSDLDPNIQVGLPWSRDPQIRVSYHPSETVSMAVSLETPDTYGGGAGGSAAITLPDAFAPNYSNQIDVGTGALALPGRYQDLVGKIAFDPRVGERHFHIELVGLFSRFKFYNPQTNTSFRTEGGGFSVNAEFPITPNLRLYTNNFRNNGGGRYIFGQGPDLIILPDGSPSLVRSMSTQEGLEYSRRKNWLMFIYYGGSYFYRNAVYDPVANQQVGFGYSGAPTGHNRTIQEISAGVTKVLFDDPMYGRLQFSPQYSWVTRSPWSVPPGTPRTASMNMFYLDIRYFLPSAPPTVR